MEQLKLRKISRSKTRLPSIPILSIIDLNSARHINGLLPGFTFILEFFLYSSVNIGRYFFSKVSIYSQKKFFNRQF